MTSYDVTGSFVHIVDADRDEAREVLGQIDPMRSLADRLSALGLDDRAVWTESGELTYSLVWRFGAGGHARLDWRISVEPAAAGRTVLTVKLGARGSNEETARRLLRSWTLVEELAQAHTRRLARTLDDYANADDYSVAPARLRAVV
jgi:hypothetical protein